MTIFLGFTTGLFLGALVVLVVAGMAIAAMQQDYLTMYEEQLKENENLITRLDNHYFMKELGLEKNEETEAE